MGNNDNLRGGLLQQQQQQQQQYIYDCNPPTLFSSSIDNNANDIDNNKGSLPLVKIIAGPKDSVNDSFFSGNQYTTTKSINGDLHGYPESLFQSYKYPWGDRIKYVFDITTTNQQQQQQEYNIILGFADIQNECQYMTFQRIFDVKINGLTYIQGMNIKSLVGCNTAYVVNIGNVYPNINSKSIEIELIKSNPALVNKPIISFISIQPIIPENRRHLKECNHFITDNYETDNIEDDFDNDNDDDEIYNYDDDDTMNTSYSIR